MVVFIISIAAVILIFLGSIFVSVACDLFNAGRAGEGVKNYIVGFSMLISACIASFLAGAM